MTKWRSLTRREERPCLLSQRGDLCILTSCLTFFHQGEWEAAIALFTEAIKLNPNSAAMFAKRGYVDYLKLSSFCNISTSSGHASLRFRNQMHVFEIVQGKDGFP